MIEPVARQITLRGATGTYRFATFEGNDYVVVPVVALVEGVIRALNSTGPEFVPAEVFSQAPKSWDGRPVMHNHPITASGAPISANSPDVLEAACFGQVFNTKVDGKKLLMEGWINVAKVTALGGAAKATYDRILTNKPVEVSVGCFVVAEQKSGTYNNVAYDFVWHTIVPDHLAFLEEGHTGACSNTMGCGVRAAAVHLITAEGIAPMSEAVAKRTLRERLKDILPFRSSAKGYSDTDVRDALREAVRQQEPLYAYIESVYESDGYFIYCTISQDPQSYEEHYYKRTFTLDKAAGTVSLGAERTEVAPVVKFEPLQADEGQPKAACSCHKAPESTNQPSESEVVTMSRQERIAALLANANCPIKVQTELEALSDVSLAALEEKSASPNQPSTPAPPPLTPPATPTSPNPPSVPAPQTPSTPNPPSTPAPTSTPRSEAAPVSLEEWRKTAPAEVLEMVDRHAAQDAQVKNELVAALKTAQKSYSEDELKAMTIPALQKIADLLKIEQPRAAVDFSARNPLPRAAENDNSAFTPPNPYAPKDKK